MGWVEWDGIEVEWVGWGGAGRGWEEEIQLTVKLGTLGWAGEGQCGVVQGGAQKGPCGLRWSKAMQVGLGQVPGGAPGVVLGRVGVSEAGALQSKGPVSELV